MDDGLVERVVDHLFHVALRPAMYAGRCSVDAIRTYLHGVQAGLRCAGREYDRSDYDAAAKSRGWDSPGPMGIEHQCIAKGLSEVETIREQIAVEADAYRRALARSSESDRPVETPEPGA